MYYVNVALDIPLYRLFSYSSTQLIKVGTRVLVNFSGKEVIGFIWENNVTNDSLVCEPSKIKPVLYVFSECLAEDIYHLVEFCSRYYLYPLGQTLFNAIPSVWRKTQAVKFKAKACKSPPTYETTYALKLNSQQQEIVTQVSQNLTQYYPALLYGVTGSGKTEVYLELIRLVLDIKKQALVLVPEINLTPQLLTRFKQRFPLHNIHVLTSNVTNPQRLIGYIGAIEGNIDIIIGTRLALFTPFKNLGLIVVDEEHETSFKQQESLRYNARDLAVWRAKNMHIPVVLGSATPSLETLYNYKLGKYHLFKLSARAVSTAVLPEIRLIDVSSTKGHIGLAPVAQSAIGERLASGELSLVFINRRGYAPIISCYECGWVGKCSNCSSNLVFHSISREIKCHHCGVSSKVPQACPVCKSQHLQTLGQGTQKIEELLVKSFPQARIYRIDQDTLNTKKAWEELYAKIKRHEIDIIIGTQILAKGHDFHNLTLVVGLNIDNGLYSYDFRASEFLFTQLTQVAGRAGRGNKSGLVLLQTSYPQHELYQYLLNHDFAGFANYLLKQRKVLSLPPYTHYAMLRVTSKNLSSALEYLTNIKCQVKIPAQVIVYPPVPAVLYRLKNRERAQMLIYSQDRQVLHQYLTKVVDSLSGMRKIGDILWQLDVDPLEI